MRRLIFASVSGAAIGFCAATQLAWREAERAVMREVARAKQPHWS